ncbi:TatD family hydrolase [Treponema sp. OttesenSCG-928-L16]|nr:TatD family hydrolase [Treponema sp. OttesenSCG-928-L16]
METKIPTALGLIKASDLGITSAHEHIRVSEKYRDEAIAFQVADLKKAKALGLNTIVELTPTRDIDAIKEVSEKAEINVIVSTGHYVTEFTDEEKKFSVNDYVEKWLSEIEYGIGRSKIRPGVIKVGSSGAVFNEDEEKILRAGGQLQKKTGLPVCVHSVSGCRNQQDIFEAEGADLSKVYFSHVEAQFGWEERSLSDEIDYLESVVKKGSYLCYNNFGNWAHTSKENLAAIISAMIDRGYGDQHLASMDVVVSYPEGSPKVLWDDINPDGARRMYSYLLSDVLPWIKESGVSEKNAVKMVKENVAHLFA